MSDLFPGIARNNSWEKLETNDLLRPGLLFNLIAPRDLHPDTMKLKKPLEKHYLSRSRFNVLMAIIRKVFH